MDRRFQTKFTLTLPVSLLLFCYFVPAEREVVSSGEV